MELPQPPCPWLWETAGPGQLSLAAPSEGPLAASQASPPGRRTLRAVVFFPHVAPQALTCSF